MSQGKPNLELVEQYLNNHLFPILERIQERIEDPQLVAVALRSTTRHIFHWLQDREQGMPKVPTGAAAVEREAADAPIPEANGSRAITRAEAYEAAKDRAPGDWVSGNEPATPRQIAVLRDRAIPHGASITKAEASLLITQHVYGGARA